LCLFKVVQYVLGATAGINVAKEKNTDKSRAEVVSVVNILFFTDITIADYRLMCKFLQVYIKSRLLFFNEEAVKGFVLSFVVFCSTHLFLKIIWPDFPLFVFNKVLENYRAIRQ